MQLFAFGINHQTAPLDVREQVSFPADEMEHALRDLVGHHPVREAAIVSTCNRTEIYCSTEKPEEATHWLADFHQLQGAGTGALSLQTAARKSGEARISCGERT